MKMGVLGQYWIRWKMLRLPWRKKFLIGQDLSGNTYWEFKDALNHNRLRRTARYPRGTHHADVQVSPLWHQWLRYTRSEPPTLQEQSADLVRQSQLKQNAMLADARWAAKAKYIESPKPNADAQRHATTRADEGATGAEPAQASARERPSTKQDPWAKADETASKPGSKWQPEAWVPGATRR